MDLGKLEKVLNKAGYELDGGNSSSGSLQSFSSSCSAEVWLLVDGVPFFVSVNRKESKPVDVSRYFNYNKG